MICFGCLVQGLWSVSVAWCWDCDLFWLPGAGIAICGPFEAAWCRDCDLFPLPGAGIVIRFGCLVQCRDYDLFRLSGAGIAICGLS